MFNRNVSEQLHGKGTSEEAEIEAATRAIQLALKIGNNEEKNISIICAKYINNKIYTMRQVCEI